MLELKLSELISPELVTAFREQWSVEPRDAEEAAREAIRFIAAPQDERERNIAKLIVELVGPEPDAFAWLEALTVGDFKISDSVTYVVGRAKENPAAAIKRQQQRIANLADKHRLGPANSQALSNAYNDALRLMVAASLLTQMRKGIAAKAALGPAWPLMVSVMENLLAGEKRALAKAGADIQFRGQLAEGVRDALNAHAVAAATSEDSLEAGLAGGFPTKKDVDAFFERGDFYIPGVGLTSRSAKALIPHSRPRYIRDAETELNDHGIAAAVRYRASIFLLKTTSAEQVSAFAIRAAHRREARERFFADPQPERMKEAYIEQAIWDHVMGGGFMPLGIPLRHLHYLEEDACWAFNDLGNDWPGLAIWQRHGCFEHERDSTKIANLDLEGFGTDVGKSR